MGELKTIGEWADKDKIVIIDPGGFDKDDPYLFKRKYSREYYNARINYCTVKQMEE